MLDGEFTATFAEHRDRVCRLADGMAGELGVGRGDPFAVMALNGHQFLELYHASFLGGSVINPLNLRLAPQELAFIIKDSASRVCFADAFFAPLIDGVRAEAGIEKVVLIGAGDVPHDLAYEDLVAAGAPIVPDEPEEDDPAVLMYTGGTTGLPKGVVIDNRALMLDLYKVATRFGMNDQLVYLHQTPMFHAASLGGVLAVAAVGGQTTFVPVFQPAAVLDAIERHQVTMTVMVPTMVAMLLDHPDFRPGTHGLAAGAHLRGVTDAHGPAPAGTGGLPRRRSLPGIRDDGELRSADLPRTRGAPPRRRSAAVGRTAPARLGGVHPGRGRRRPARRRDRRGVRPGRQLHA